MKISIFLMTCFISYQLDKIINLLEVAK